MTSGNTGEDINKKWEMLHFCQACYKIKCNTCELGASQDIGITTLARNNLKLVNLHFSLLVLAQLHKEHKEVHV